MAEQEVALQQDRGNGRRSTGQGIELARRGRSISLWAVGSSHAEYVDRLHTGDKNSRASLAFEPQHRSHHALDRPVILFDDVVQIPALSKDDLSIVFGGVVVDGSGICPASRWQK